MRTAFIQQLTLEARSNPRLFLVVGDLGFSVIEPFAKEFPTRYLNAGVAEQNMTGVAAGLASEGYQVFTYSIANFPTLRCFEQIRNDVCYHRLPVTIVAVGAGVAYGNMGFSHHGVQDIAVMRTLPHITVLSPADPDETTECVRYLSRNPGPSYLRIGKAGEPRLHCVRGIESSPLTVIAAESEVAIVATGSPLRIAMEAARVLAARGSPVPVFSCPWIHPLSDDRLRMLAKYRKLYVLEEHIAIGGFASALRERLPGTVEIHPVGLNSDNVGDVGSQQYLWERSGLSVENLVRLLTGAERGMPC